MQVKLFKVRIFEKLEESINEWLSENKDIEVRDIKIMPLVRTRVDIDSDLVAMIIYTK